MKLTISFAEVRNIILSTYRLPSYTDIHIPELGRKNEAALLSAEFIHRGILDPETNMIRPDQKIAAIKGLREIVMRYQSSCGLAKAKQAIEDWSKFYAYVANNGFPNMNSNHDAITWC